MFKSEESDYARAKQMLSSCYGTVVTDEEDEPDGLDAVPIIEIDRQIEVTEKLIKEYKIVLKNLNKLHNDVFMYAPESLEWSSGDAMSCVDGEIKEQIEYLEDWLKYMKPYARRRHGEV